MNFFSYIALGVWLALHLGATAADQQALADPFQDPTAPAPATKSEAKAPPTPQPPPRDPQNRPYFPKDQTDDLYANYLSHMKEPSLIPSKEEKQGFGMRFLWIRSFHNPIAVRVWRKNDEYWIKGVSFEMAGHDFGPVTKSLERELTGEEWMQISKLADPPEIWKPLSKEERAEIGSGFDGAHWIFERRNQKDYFILDLWSPKGREVQTKTGSSEGSKIRDFEAYVRLALLLLKLTDLTPDEKQIY